MTKQQKKSSKKRKTDAVKSWRNYCTVWIAPRNNCPISVITLRVKRMNTSFTKAKATCATAKMCRSKESIHDYFRREVKPHVPEAWIDLDKTKIGYEISFNKYFYQHKPLRSIEEVSA
jgi:hypothetical protein